MLGDSRSNNSNGKSNKIYENTYYSRIRFKNNDKLALGFSFKSGMLVVSIDQEKDGFQYETLTSCYLTGCKANILLRQIDAYKADPKNNYYGINTGMGDIATVLVIHMDNGKDAITIGKVNNEGKYVSKYTFRFDDITDGIKLTDISNMGTAEKVAMTGLEFEMFTQTIASFANNINGAIAYSVADLTKYDHSSILKKMDPIYDKLGIERMVYGSRSGGASENNFFNGSNGGFRGKSNNTSLDNIMDDIPSEDD